MHDKMLEAAEKRRIKEKINNAEYKCMSWQETDITGWEDSFDLVFAHMTPAVNTKESFEKMRKVSKNCCVVTKSVYRKNEIAENIDRICGNITKGYGESELAELFMILWADGITPMTYYEKEIWKNEMSVQSASDSYIKRMSVKKELSESEKNDISRYFASIAKDGMITEITDVILCNVYWRENK